MKRSNHLLVAAAAVVTLNLTQPVRAADPVLAPRAAQLWHDLRKVPATTEVDLAKDHATGGAKARELAHSLRRVPASGSDVNLAHGPRPTLSPKDPRYEMVLRENALQQLQVAPLK
jgi:hypothetical protein